MRRRLIVLAWIGVAVAAPGFRAAAAQADAVPRVTFRDAIARALQRNPSVQQAADEILRADALLQESRAVLLPGVSAGAVNTTLNEGRSFSGNVATPQNQVAATATVSGLIYAPVQWALHAQAADARQVAELAAAEVRRQVALATAQAYLVVIARQRVVDANLRARDVARAHYEFARQRREGGAGSRLNELRAQQSLSSDEALVEQANLDLYRSQEALGVLVADDGPLSVADEPVLEVPISIDAAVAAISRERADLLLTAGRERAAERVVSDSWKDWLPSVTGLFQPQYVRPGTLFQPTWSWRAQIAASVSIFDGGFRRARRAERQVALDEIRVSFGGQLRQANSDVREARASVSSAQRVLASAQAAALQASEVVEIVNVSFRVGASTNIEVIDAQRAARDADTVVALAENQLRQAKLALLVSLGQFP